MRGGFPRLVVSSGLSNLADGVFQVALPLVTLGVTRDPGAFSLVTLSMKLPWLLWALPAGALADRLDRRRTMFLVNLVRVGLIGGLALAVGANADALWLLCVVGFALGVGETMYDTAAQSIVPNLVEADDLSRANGRLFAVELVMNQFVGPPLGGLIVAATAAGALSMSAGAYLLAGLIMMMIRGSFRPVRDGPPSHLRHDIAEGLRYVFGHRLLRTLALITGIFNLWSFATLAVLPIYAVDPGPMGLSKGAFGFLMGAGALGAAVGSVFAARVENALGRAKTLWLGMLTFPLLENTPAVTTSAWVVGACSAVGGAVAVNWNVITVSLRQRITPDAMLGRMNSVYRLLAWGSMPIGAFIGGQLGDFFGVRAVFVVAALGTLAFLPLLVRVVTESSIAAAESGSATGDTPNPEAIAVTD